MSRVAVIGATGHVGTYLVPRLVRAGHEVVALSRGEREPYHAGARVARGRAPRGRPRCRGRRRHVRGADRGAGRRRRDRHDLLHRRESAQQLVDALRPTRPLLVHCGTIWVHGAGRARARSPRTSRAPRTATYGTGKAAIEALLWRETIAGGVPSVILHPGHISGPGWPVITPAGNLDSDVWRRLATGEPLRAARPRPRRAPPRARRRRRAGVRARVDPARRRSARASTSSPSRR